MRANGLGAQSATVTPKVMSPVDLTRGQWTLL